jgi:sec-independent protein translocase protein TatA
MSFGISNFLAWAPGPLEWIIILVLALLIFGNRLPALAKGMGKSIFEFKKGLKEGQEEEKASSTDPKN